jgi:hypothetical protein
MPQITNSQLMDCLHKLEERVKIIEEKAHLNDITLEKFSARLEAVSTTLETISRSLFINQRVTSIFAAILTPIITGIIVIIVQHFFFH